MVALKREVLCSAGMDHVFHFAVKTVLMNIFDVAVCTAGGCETKTPISNSAPRKWAELQPKQFSWRCVVFPHESSCNLNVVSTLAGEVFGTLFYQHPLKFPSSIPLRHVTEWLRHQATTETKYRRAGVLGRAHTSSKALENTVSTVQNFKTCFGT